MNIQQKILNLPPVKWFVKTTSGIPFPGLQKVTVYDVLILLVKQLQREAVNVRAAAISFNFLMALPALIIFIAAIIPMLPASKLIFDELIALIMSLTPNMRVRDLAIDYLSNILNRDKTGLISVGIILALYYSSRAMLGVINSFDRSVKYNRAKTNVFKKRIRAIQLTAVIVLLLIGTLLILLGQGSLFKTIMDWLNIENVFLQWMIKNFRWIIIILLFYYSISIIYTYGPSVKKRRKLNTVGSWLATALIVIATALFSYWAQNFSQYNKFYGPIGSLMLLMLSVYINSLMLLIGFELNNSIDSLEQDMPHDV